VFNGVTSGCLSSGNVTCAALRGLEPRGLRVLRLRSGTTQSRSPDASGGLAIWKLNMSEARPREVFERSRAPSRAEPRESKRVKRVGNSTLTRCLANAFSPRGLRVLRLRGSRAETRDSGTTKIERRPERSRGKASG
jgi:hypothetical protein